MREMTGGARVALAPRAAGAHPTRLAGVGRPERRGAGAVSLGKAQDAARWRARGRACGAGLRLGAHAPEVVAQRRPRRTRGPPGLPWGGRGAKCRFWHRARRGAGAKRRQRAGRAVNGHKRLSRSLHRIRVQLFLHMHPHIGRRGAVGAKKSGIGAVLSEFARLVHADRPKSVRLEGWLRG